MTANLIRRTGYSRAERLSDAIVHMVALVAALSAVPVLITLAAVWRGDASAIVGTAVYGGTLIAMILCSALYNMFDSSAWQGLLRRLDHSAIYFKIAGTYTPFMLLSGGHGTWLLTGLWGAALAGSGLRSFGSPRWKWVAFGLYLAMGWAGLVFGWPLMSALSAPVLGLIVAGGLLYTLGTAFLLWESLPFHNTVWHVFVMTASATFFVAVTLHLAETSAPVAG